MVEANPAAQAAVIANKPLPEEVKHEEESKAAKPKKKAKVTSAKKFKINTLDSNHVQPLLKKLIEDEPKWQEVENRTASTLRWVHPNLPDQEVLDWLQSGSAKMANRYPDIKLLAHKDVFGRAMRFCMDIDEEAYNFIPPTFQLPDNKDMQRFEAYQKKHPNAIYIAKPQVGAQGDSISLF